MPKIDPKQQPPSLPADYVSDVLSRNPTVDELRGTFPPLRSLGPFDVASDDVSVGLTEGQRALRIDIDAQQSPDAYAIRETVIYANGVTGARSYRTEQRMELATRLQLPPDYDPADLVGRTFLVPA